MEKAEKERKQKLSFCFVPSRSVRENFIKIAKIFKKLKNTITASFQTQNRMEKAETERKEKLSLRFVPSRRGRENSKKIAKKFKKLKNTITASFQGKMGWKTLRNGENKNYRYVSFLPDVQEKIPKK